MLPGLPTPLLPLVLLLLILFLYISVSLHSGFCFLFLILHCPIVISAFLVFPALVTLGNYLPTYFSTDTYQIGALSGESDQAIVWSWSDIS